MTTNAQKENGKKLHIYFGSGTYTRNEKENGDRGAVHGFGPKELQVMDRTGNLGTESISGSGDCNCQK